MMIMIVMMMVVVCVHSNVASVGNHFATGHSVTVGGRGRANTAHMQPANQQEQHHYYYYYYYYYDC